MTLDPQLTTAIVGVLATAVTVLGGWGLSILERKLGIDKSDRATAIFEAAIQNGISTGAKVVAEKIAAGQNVGNPQTAVIAEALAYAQPKLTGELKTLKIAPNTLPERVAARVASVMPATPPGLDPVKVTEALNAAQLKKAA